MYTVASPLPASHILANDEDHGKQKTIIYSGRLGASWRAWISLTTSLSRVPQSPTDTGINRLYKHNVNTDRTQH